MKQVSPFHVLFRILRGKEFEKIINVHLIWLVCRKVPEGASLGQQDSDLSSYSSIFLRIKSEHHTQGFRIHALCTIDAQNVGSIIEKLNNFIFLLALYAEVKVLIWLW